MPGAYAHLTLVGLIGAPNYLDKVPDFPPDAKSALLDNAQFCDLGAVSPDYPYLNLMRPSDTEWADLMHHERTGDMIKAGVALVRQMKGPARDKAFAWLLGYAAHVGADVTIHPVVQRKVGPYLGNEKAHRVCEMHQDAYIFQRLQIGQIGLCEYLDSGIWRCCDKQNSGKLDPAITSVWQGMLQACYPNKYRLAPPETDDWHEAFRSVVDKAEEADALPAFARHVAVNCGWTYPSIDAIDAQYIKGLDTPFGKMDYDNIFNRAMDNVLMLWSLIAAAVFKGEDGYQKGIDNWDLDTGADDSGKLVFWEVRV